MVGGIGTREIATRYPNVRGLIAGTTTQTGNKEFLTPQMRRPYRRGSSANIVDAPVNVMLLETNDFALLEDGDYIGLE